MNIIEAREAAMAGKTVIAPDGTECCYLDLYRTNMFMHSYVFGEWSVKREPVVFELEVTESAMRPGYGRLDPLCCKPLYQFIGKRVKVTVEVLDDQA